MFSVLQLSPDAACNTFYLKAKLIIYLLNFFRVGCGGWTTQFKGLYFENVKYRTLHRWNWDAVNLVYYHKSISETNKSFFPGLSRLRWLSNRWNCRRRGHFQRKHYFIQSLLQRYWSIQKRFSLLQYKNLDTFCNYFVDKIKFTVVIFIYSKNAYNYFKRRTINMNLSWLFYLTSLILEIKRQLLRISPKDLLIHLALWLLLKLTRFIHSYMMKRQDQQIYLSQEPFTDSNQMIT